MGPTLLGMTVNWDDWESLDRINQCTDLDEGCFSTAIEAWYAGFEVELGSLFGTLGTDEEAAYLGIAREPEFIEEVCRSRYRDVPSEVGLLGHRLAWTAKGLHLLGLHTPVIYKAGVFPFDRRASFGDSVSRIGWRAAAFSRERLRTCSAYDDRDARAALRRGLIFLASFNRARHRMPPLYAQIRQGHVGPVVDEANLLRDEVMKHLVDIAAWRRRQKDREVRLWAKSAGSAQLHRATKDKETVTPTSASADKGHLGELTEQAAANRGAGEWGALWRARQRAMPRTSCALLKRRATS